MLANRIAVIQQHDLSTQAGLDRSAQEEILKRKPSQMDADPAVMKEDNARALRCHDTEACVDFLSSIPTAHDSDHSWFKNLYGSMAFGLVNIETTDLKT